MSRLPTFRFGVSVCIVATLASYGPSGADDGGWRVDMGSDEFGSHCPGDLDGDDDIDLADLAAFLANYGSTSGMTPADGDSDLDGDVDLSDLAALLAMHGLTCE